MNSTDVEYRVEGHVAHVTTNRPQYRNAQSRRLLEELDAAFGRAVEDAGRAGHRARAAPANTSPAGTISDLRG